MSNFRSPDLHQRKEAGAAAKKALFEKFKAAAAEPRVAEKQAIRQSISEARAIRTAERKAADEKRKAELAVIAEQNAKIKLEQKLEEEKLQQMLEADAAERQTQLLAEQKAARDARYAARKAAKKERRKG